MPPRGKTVSAGPVASAERIELLDTLRGIAVFGIFLLNFNHDYLAESQSLIDRVARMAIDFCCEASFYPLFSFLFGLGFALQIQRFATRGGGFDRTYLRRLAVLFGIGVALAILLWRGDVPWRYALLGVLLLASKWVGDPGLSASMALELRCWSRATCGGAGG
jgi:uncharacterized protein